MVVKWTCCHGNTCVAMATQLLAWQQTHYSTFMPSWDNCGITQEFLQNPTILPRWKNHLCTLCNCSPNSTSPITFNALLSFRKIPLLVRVLPHLGSFWFFVGHLQLLFEAHPQIFISIRALLILITWPRSSPPPAPHNYPIAPDFISIYSNSMWEYMSVIPDHSIQYSFSYSRNIPDPFNLESELHYFRYSICTQHVYITRHYDIALHSHPNDLKFGTKFEDHVLSVYVWHLIQKPCSKGCNWALFGQLPNIVSHEPVCRITYKFEIRSRIYVGYTMYICIMNRWVGVSKWGIQCGLNPPPNQYWTIAGLEISK